MLSMHMNTSRSHTEAFNLQRLLILSRANQNKYAHTDMHTCVRAHTQTQSMPHTAALTPMPLFDAVHLNRHTISSFLSLSFFQSKGQARLVSTPGLTV